MYGDEERRGREIALVHDELQGVHGHGAPCGGLVVSVVHLVDLLVQPGLVEQSVEVVRHGLVVDEKANQRECKVKKTSFGYTVVHLRASWSPKKETVLQSTNNQLYSHVHLR